MGDFKQKVGREDIFKPIIFDDGLHEVSNGNGVRVINFVTSKNLIISSTTFAHRDIPKHSWTSDRVTHNHIDHAVIDKTRHSNIVKSIPLVEL
jgi:hypothetical protein